MNVLITGGTGFIGSRLALACRAAGHGVRALGQENTPAEAENRALIERQGVDVILRSITEPGLDDAFESTDVVFHLAAAQHEMNVPDQRFWDVNVAGTRNVFDAACRAGVSRVVHGSTIGVYGQPNGRLDEDSPCRPDNIYGVTKLEGERVALSYRDRLEVVVIRIPEVYGPGDRRLVKLFRPIQNGRFVVIGSGQNIHHAIYIDDLTAGLLQAAVHPAAVGGLFLLAGSEAVSTNQMVEAVAHAVGRPAPRWRLPLFPFAIAAAVLEQTLRPLGIQPPLHRRRLDFFRKSFVLSDERARRTLDFRPAVSFAEGAQRAAAWYRDAGCLT